jgi:hypothetical protein
MFSSVVFDNVQVWDDNQTVKVKLFFAKLRDSIWYFGIPSWIFGIYDRVVAAFADGCVSAIEFFHFFAATIFFLSWLLLKPKKDLNLEPFNLSEYQPDLASQPDLVYEEVTQTRLAELQDHHVIRQEYVLPYPYLCQIYHLLNLKHLESVHNFSLGNLKIVGVSDFQPTTIGGVLRFQTVLDSPMNILRIWRQPIVEVELILHTPYTIELRIPAYRDRKIVVIFNAIPLGNDVHRFVVDIYSNLGWFKPLLKFILHIASCLTLFEDLPYLQALAKRNIHQLLNAGRVTNQENMRLFQRFVDLYGSGIEAATRSQLLLEQADEIQPSLAIEGSA